jgi:hypothetical protein
LVSKGALSRHAEFSMFTPGRAIWRDPQTRTRQRAERSDGVQ